MSVFTVHTSKAAPVPPADKKNRKRPSLHRNMGRWMMLLAALPVLICMTMFNLHAGKHQAIERRRDGANLTKVAAASLSHSGVIQSRNALIESLRTNSNVAFVCLTDVKGRVIYPGVFDPQAWQAYQSNHPWLEGALQLPEGQVSVIEVGRSLVVHVAPIWSWSWGREPHQTRKVHARLPVTCPHE